jgi:cytochrome P450
MKVDWAIVQLPYGDVWRRKRKLMYSHMNPGAVARYHPVLVTTAHRFARSIPTAEMSPEGLQSAVSLYLGQTLIKAMYGIDVANAQSDFIRLPQKLVENFTLISIPGNFMVDVFPLCEDLASICFSEGFLIKPQ